MPINGLYRTTFQTPLGAGSGVVYASAGKMWGGDAGIYYTGTYTESGNQVTAQVVTDRHSPSPFGSVFGLDRVHITLTGSGDGDSSLILNGKAAEVPNVTFQVILTKISA